MGSGVAGGMPILSTGNRLIEPRGAVSGMPVTQISTNHRGLVVDAQAHQKYFK